MYTGNIVLRNPRFPRLSVYPCVYREHGCAAKRINIRHGLSLCIQGTSSSPDLIIFNKRFIPVYTGNIHISSHIIDSKSVYPCVYREHLIFSIAIAINCGLSLCVQGTYCGFRPLYTTFRFIPVCTGNMHIAVYRLTKRTGLSLCVQGTYVYSNYCGWMFRFIPVCTGNI